MVLSGGASVTGSGTVTSATQDITGIDLSTLDDGTITFSVMLTNAVGASEPVTGTAQIDRELPTAIALSTSVAVAGAANGSTVAYLETASANPTAGAYTYTLLTPAAPFAISGNDLVVSGSLGPVGSTYTLNVQSTDALLNSIQQTFTITVASSDPVSPVVSLAPANGGTANSSTSVSIAPDAGTGVVDAGTTVGTLSTAAASGGIVGSQVNYSLVSGTGDTNNSSFTIGADGQLEAAAGLAPGSYSVLVQSTSTPLVSDVLGLGSTAGDFIGPYALQLTLDPSQMPAGFAQLAANAGLIGLVSVPAPGVANPATTANKEAPGSLVQTSYQDPPATSGPRSRRSTPRPC